MDAARHIGLELAAFTFEVDRSQLRLFAKAIGETDPVYTDVEAAREAGYPDLPAPPTFAFTVGMRPDAPFDFLDALGVELKTVLHGEQVFQYERPICAGDRVQVRRRVIDAYEKRGGALSFYVVETRHEDEATGELFAMARQTVVSRAGAYA